jgi:hypothetical protein
MKGLAPLLALAVFAPPALAEKLDYSRDVLPILSANCFVCHGRDVSTRKAKLRLDLRDNATALHQGLFPIVPGNPEESELIARITSNDEDERMPPPDRAHRLSSQQIAILTQWIAEGAEYNEHWAYLPPKRVAPPAVQRSAWAASPVDRFVLARLEAEKLSPAPQTAKATLIRRATLDLTGLPPTPAELEAFVADKSPDAFARLVDRLLASPHYGERYGRHWLDVARYADSGGFETDLFFGHAWRFRDYVIRSFNADKPFDRFIKEQIAGDELYPDDEEAKIATGLYTTGPVLQEAGMVKGKLEYDQLTDAVDTTGAAFVGLTFACARCHDHKYDPISQKEYYSLQAIFAASDQFDFTENGTKIRDRAALKTTLKEFEAEQARLRAQREKDPIRRAELVRKAGDAFIEADNDLKARIDSTKRYNTIWRAVDYYQHVAADGDKFTDTGHRDPTDAEDDDANDANDVIALKAELAAIVHSQGADKAESALLDVGVVALLNPPPRGSFNFNRGGGNAAQAGAAPAKAADADIAAVDNPPAAPVAGVDAAAGNAGAAAGRRRGGGQGFMFGRRAFSQLKTDAEKRAFLLTLGKQQLELKKPDNYVDDIDALRLETGEKHLRDISALPVRMLAHRDAPLETHVLRRGELEMPGEVVEPGLPERIAAGFTFDAPTPDRRRAALAEWIASDKNLLTARVIANRVWQWHFGEGLVRTPNDFGVSGDRPSHPELLDWLAMELVEHGWSLKHLHRVIMLSNAYQMASTADEKTLERDPDNRLLTRFQPHRLEAEVIWDSLRAAAGTLDLTMYGLPIAPPLDEQEQLGNYRKWPASTPEEANRRAIYILVKRSFRFPMLSAFDLPDNITSCGRRDITTIPNQALTLLNNGTMRRQAAAFADRLLGESKGHVEAIPDRAWLYAYGRHVTADERTQLTRFLQERTVADGDVKAALTELCLAIFNTNEFIYQQ